jgi:hypothetical protein
MEPAPGFERQEGRCGMQSIQAVIESLERAPHLIVPLVREMPREILQRRPAPKKWSAHEHACHLTVVQPMITGRLDLMLKEDRPRITPYNPDTATPDDALLKLDIDAELARFTMDRKAVVERLRRLTPADWAREADHPEYARYSVFIMLRHVALHDLFHAYRIEELLLKKEW